LALERVIVGLGSADAMLAAAVLAAHLVIVLFNVFGLVAVPIGAVRGWRFVRIRWWRLLHILLLAAVAGQAFFGRACILTLWQAALAGGAAERTPLIMRWVDRLIYWPLPLWVFAVLYAVVFGYALALFWLVPPRRRAEGHADRELPR
jgi:Protein of Unknown function (DUF2784)